MEPNCHVPSPMTETRAPSASTNLKSGFGRSDLADQTVVHDLRPRLHAKVVNAHLGKGEQLARELRRLADRDAGRVSLYVEHDSEVHLRHRRRLVVQEAEQPSVEPAFVDDLLLPLAAHSVEDRVATAFE